MVKELILHIGDCEAGAKTVQACLRERAYTLPRGGTLFFPAVSNHNLAALSVSTLPDAPHHAPYRAARFAEIARQMSESDADWGVISSDLFEFVPAKDMKAVLDEFFPDHAGRIRLIAYVRPHLDRIVSAYAESLKTAGAPPRMRGIFERRKGARGMYHPRLSAWKEIFGEALTVRPYTEDRLRAGRVDHDFIALATGQPRARSTLDAPRDVSLPVPDLAMMREVHSCIMTLDGGEGEGMALARRQVGWQLAPMLAERHVEAGSATDNALRMPRGLAEEAAAHFREDAVAMDTTFFKGQPLEEALDAGVAAATPKPQSLAIEDHFAPAEVSRIRAWAEFTGRLAIADPGAFFRAALPPEERAARAEPVPDPGAAPSATTPAPRRSLLRWIRGGRR